MLNNAYLSFAWTWFRTVFLVFIWLKFLFVLSLIKSCSIVYIRIFQTVFKVVKLFCSLFAITKSLYHYIILCFCIIFTLCCKLFNSKWSALFFPCGWFKLFPPWCRALCLQLIPCGWIYSVSPVVKSTLHCILCSWVYSVSPVVESTLFPPWENLHCIPCDWVYTESSVAESTLYPL